MAPEAIVTAVAANTAWKKKSVKTLRPSEPNSSSAPSRKKVSVPSSEPASAP